MRRAQNNSTDPKTKSANLKRDGFVHYGRYKKSPVDTGKARNGWNYGTQS